MARTQAVSPEELCAAYLADPGRKPPTDLAWTSCNAQRLLQLLQKNKVPLLSLAAASPHIGAEAEPVTASGETVGIGPELRSLAAFAAARQGESDELAALRGEYKLAQDALSAHGVVGILIKSVGLKPSFPFKSDNLDVLYKPGDVGQVRATLRQLGYVELTNMEEPHKYLFRKFHAGHSVSAIHLHEHVGWMTSFLDEDRLWQRCRPAPDDGLLTISAPEDALLTTLAHWFYEDKRLTLQDVVKSAHCLRQGVDWDEMYRIATWRGWRDGLNASLLLHSRQEHALYGQTLVPASILEEAWRGIPDWARMWLERLAATAPRPRSGEAEAGMPLRIPFLFSKAFFYAKLIRDPSRSTAQKAKDLVVHTGYGTKLRLHIHSQPAMLVTFSGVDGCGKTTQARALQSAFETCHLRADYVWNRGGSARWVGLLSQWSKRLSPRISNETQTMAANERTIVRRMQQFRSPWTRCGWSWLTTTELLLQYTWRVTVPLLLGHVVICDRYIYDALGDWSVYFDEAAVEKRMAARVLCALTRRPRMAYWLDVPAEVAQSRSSDGLPAHFLTAQSVAYARLATLYGLRRLDGSHPWEELSDSVVYDVLGAYFSNYRTCLNSLFLKNPGQWR